MHLDLTQVAAVEAGMQLDLSDTQASALDETTAPSMVPQSEGDNALLAMHLTEAKRRAAAAFERRYLIHVMERARGSVSEGARLSGLDRTNFRRLLQRHGLRAAAPRSEMPQ